VARLSAPVTRFAAWSLVAALAPVALPAQSPDDGRVVTGRVADELGRPIRGAAVGVLRCGDENTEELLHDPQATTASDGTFRVVNPLANPDVLPSAFGSRATLQFPGRAGCCSSAIPRAEQIGQNGLHEIASYSR
jgi:hypothetical protein